MHWVVVKTSIEFPNTHDPEILGIFENRDHAIGELIKYYIKYNVNLISKEKLNQEVLDLKRKIKSGDTNDMFYDNHKYTISMGYLDKFGYFDSEIVNIYNSLK